MSKQEVIEELQARRCIIAKGGELLWVHSAEPSIFVGTLGFSGDRLESISRDWPLGEEPTAQYLTDTLFKVLTQVGEEADEPIHVELKVATQPNISGQVIRFLCGHRSVVLILNQDRTGQKHPEYYVTLNDELAR